MRIPSVIRAYHRHYMTRACFTSCLILSVIGAFHSGAFAAEFGTLKGTVAPAGISAEVKVNATGKLPAGVPRSYMIDVNSDGSFEKELRPGSYYLTIAADGYVYQSLSFTPDKSPPFDITDLGIRVRSNKITDMGTITLERAGSIEGVLTSDDSTDLIVVFAVRRADEDHIPYRAYDLGRCGVAIANPNSKYCEIGQFGMVGLKPGIYDFSIASRKYGIKIYIPGYGPTLKSDPLALALESRLKEFADADVSGDIESQLYFYSKSNETRYDQMRSDLKRARDHRQTSDKEVTRIEYKLVSCSGNDERAVSEVLRTLESREKSSGKIDDGLTETIIHFWIKEDNVWKISGWSWLPAREATSYLNIHDYLNPSGRDPHAGPKPLGKPTVIFSDQLVGIEVKAGETTLIPPYIMERSGIRLLGK